MTAWTKEPPKEPGWYWSRQGPNSDPWPHWIQLDYSGNPYIASECAWDDILSQWWPIPILPPEEKP